MNAKSQFNPSNRPIVRLSGAVVAGGILVMVGILILVAQLTNYPGLLFLPLLALIFLAWSLLTRSSGLLIPGGILAGISAGTLLVENLSVGEPAEGGIFLLGFAGGWALISLLSLYTVGGGRWMAWPLIPGGIMAAIGALLLVGEPGLEALRYFGQGWPIILIAIGLYLILRRKNEEEEE